MEPGGRRFISKNRAKKSLNSNGSKKISSRSAEIGKEPSTSSSDSGPYTNPPKSMLGLPPPPPRTDAPSGTFAEAYQTLGPNLVHIHFAHLYLHL